jgi:hypothetical protein
MAALTVLLSDIQDIGNVASNIATIRLTACIDEARRLDLQPSLTAELLNKIDIDNASPLTYATLRAGGTYVYEDVTYSFAGLKKTLAYFVYARLKKRNSSSVTAFGNVVKTDPNSDPESEKSIARVASEYFNTGVSYLADCMDYIGRTWPTQTKSQLTPGKKFNITSIGD